MKLTEERLIEIIKEEMEANSAPTIAQTTDYIISTLESLFDSLTEDLNEIEVIEEASDVPSKAMQWIWWGPKAKKAQAKVNKIKLNIVAIEFAADNAENSKAKKKLQSKAKQAKEQRKALQTLVDDKFEAKGEVTKKYLASAKIKGQLEMLKKTTGMTDDPNQSSALKDQMKELNKKLAREDEALKSLEPSPEEQEAEKKRLKAEQKAKKDGEKTPAAAPAAAPADAAAGAPAADGAPADDGADAKLKAAKEALAKAKEGGNEDAIKKAQQALDALDKKPAAGVTKTDTKTEPKPETDTKTEPKPETDGADAKLKAAKEALAKAKEGDDEEAIKKAQSAVDALGAKESKSTKDYKRVLNESKYQPQSVRDRFSRLL